ncbi:MAG TPA: hypothetical protein VGM07_13845 [Stellaceae bacterium]|jgi:hypothetical protein
MISTVDTHELVKDLKASGFTDAQAEAVTRAVRQSQDFSDLVTKSDLALFRGEIREEIGEVRGELRAEISRIREEMVALELRLIKWMIGIGIAATLAVSGMVWAAAQVLLRALPHP